VSNRGEEACQCAGKLTKNRRQPHSRQSCEVTNRNWIQGRFEQASEPTINKPFSFIQRRLTDLRRYVRGWIGYFGLAKQVEDFLNLDMWIRRRIRMCYWKQWRYPRTKVRKLVALGVGLDMAIKHAVSRKSYWRMCNTPAMRMSEPLKRFETLC
jgi:hypothetical protein